MNILINVTFILIYFLIVGIISFLTSKYLFSKYGKNASDNETSLEKNKKKSTNFSLSNTAFAFLGFTIGLLTGLSRASAIGAVLPAILTLVGGLTIYLFINEKFKEENRIQTIFFIFYLTVFLVLGTTVGSIHRVEQEDFEFKRQKNIDFEMLQREKFFELECKKNFELFKDSILYIHNPIEQINNHIPKEPGDPFDMKIE